MKTEKDINQEALERIYKNINDGKAYASWFNFNVRYPFWNKKLYANKSYIYWSSFGSSANKNTLDDLEWIIRTIFNMTPAQFEDKYYVI